MNAALKSVAVGTVVGAVALAAAGDAMAAKRVKWKMQNAWSTQVPYAGESGLRLSDKVYSMSGEKFRIKFHEPGALVPALETFDTVSKEAIETAWTSPGYHAGRYPGLAFMTADPFGDRVYADHDQLGFDSFGIGPETSGWFKTPIESLDQMKGLKMRFFGLGGRVLSRIGVSTQLLAGADIYPALERGVIDATEFSLPTIDIGYGFYQIAKNNYFPGWHQQSSVSEFLMNKTKFEGLSEAYQEMIRQAAFSQVIYTHADADSQQFDAMKALQDEHGVTIHRWPDEHLAVFEKAWREVIEEESAKGELFKEFADSYFAEISPGWWCWPPKPPCPICPCPRPCPVPWFTGAVEGNLEDGSNEFIFSSVFASDKFPAYPLVPFPLPMPYHSGPSYLD